MNYVVLHIDVEFIVGTVCTDNGNSYPITNGHDDLLWLYFYNDARTNKITFGKNNRDNANKEITNYYGKFFNIITDGHTTFMRGEFQKDAIELLQYSDLLKTIKDKYTDVTRESIDDMTTLVTFSLSISDFAKQKTIEYLKNQGFKIESYTIPLAELVGYYPYSKNDFLPANGSIILLLVATNTTLHLMKLVFSDNYFMLDGEVKKYEGMGIDPRKRALVGYVINQINISVGALNANEILAEIEKKEFKADEWLKKIDAKAKNDNSPVRISESLSPMPSSIRDVLVKKSDIETFTNDFVNLLMDYFNAYKNDNISNDIAGIFLLGDCFNNSLVKKRFNNLFKDDDERKKKLFAYTNRDIQNILSIYPQIDFHRYINEEGRSKAKAEAEEKKMAEQRAIDAQKEAEAKAEQAKIASEKRLEENRKEAQKLFERAVELEKEGKLEDARVNVENAISLDKANREYKPFFDDLKDKIRKLNDKNELYKKYLNIADNLLKDGELEKALEEYEAAKIVFDNAEIIAKIIEVKRLIKNKETQKKQIDQLVSEASIFVLNKDFETGKDKINTILSIDDSNAEAKKLLEKIDKGLKEQAQKEIQEKCNKIIAEADKFWTKEHWKDANKFWTKEHWKDAKAKYEEALKLCPNDKIIQSKIKDCSDKIKAIEIRFKDLIFDADTLTKEGKTREALSNLEDALRVEPDNKNITEKFTKLKKKLEFENDFGNTNTSNNKTKSTSTKKIDDDWNFGKIQKVEEITKVVPQKEKLPNTDDGFLGSIKNKTIAEAPKTKKVVDNDDFLKKK